MIYGQPDLNSATKHHLEQVGALGAYVDLNRAEPTTSSRTPVLPSADDPRNTSATDTCHGWSTMYVSYNSGEGSNLFLELS